MKKRGRHEELTDAMGSKWVKGGDEMGRQGFVERERASCLCVCCVEDQVVQFAVVDDEREIPAPAAPHHGGQVPRPAKSSAR